MQPSQYFRVCVEILQHAPTNVLVFGAGRDTPMYVEANAGGRTVIVEHHGSWRERISALPCDVVAVTYSTKVSDGLSDTCDLPNGFSQDLLDVDWSVILVDSPEGYADHLPGRQQSMYAAAKAATRETVIFVHDYHRPLEQAAASRYLSQPEEAIGAKQTLAVFRGPTKVGPSASATSRHLEQPYP